MKKITLYTLLTTLVPLLLYSCKCEDATCEAFREASLDWFSFHPGDTLVYRNDAGAGYRFVMKYEDSSKPYIAKAWKNGFGGCRSEECEATAFLSGVDNTQTVPLALEYHLSQGGGASNTELRGITYSVGDFADMVSLPYRAEDRTNPFTDVHTEAQLTLGSHTYNQVLVAVKKPLPDEKPPILKLYFAEHYGIIGFEDSTGSKYYLQ